MTPNPNPILGRGRRAWTRVNQFGLRYARFVDRCLTVAFTVLYAAFYLLAGICVAVETSQNITHGAVYLAGCAWATVIAHGLPVRGRMVVAVAGFVATLAASGHPGLSGLSAIGFVMAAPFIMDILGWVVPVDENEVEA